MRKYFCPYLAGGLLRVCGVQLRRFLPRIHYLTFIGTPITVLALNVRRGLPEEELWAAYASRIARAWNMVLLAVRVSPLELDTPPLILADWCQEYGYHNLGLALVHEFSGLPYQGNLPQGPVPPFPLSARNVQWAMRED
jgi:hypothetical protein